MFFGDKKLEFKNSLYDIFSDAKIITMNGTLFNSQTIFDNIQIIIPILTVCNSRRLRTKQD